MIKGTKMIVITKSKILLMLSVVFVLVGCIAVLGAFPDSTAITAFSDYRSIIDGELMPEKEKSEAKPRKTSENRILKHFLKLPDYAPEKKTEVADTPEPTAEPQPKIQSEVRKVDKGLKVSNSTSFNVRPEDYIGAPLSFKLEGDSPQVLIMHTHTTESFSEESYVPGAPDRNLDETKNISAVGKAAAEVFCRNGINAIHDSTVHDYPSYNGAYQRAAATINKNLQNNKGIKVVLDIHRDGITREDGTKVKMVTDINGVPTAQIMLVVGTNANLKHDNWKENFKLASKIQAKAIEMYPSLMRPIDLREERFNEQLTNGSLIVEVGTNGNTLEEAVRGAQAISRVISEVLKQ